MKIEEIIGPCTDLEEPDVAPSSLLQTIANAFTRSGKVKRPLNQQLPDGQPIASQVPFSSQASDSQPSDEDSATNAVSNTSTDALLIRTTQIPGPH
jgi:hypothetical protein